MARLREAFQTISKASATSASKSASKLGSVAARQMQRPANTSSTKPAAR